MGRMTRVCAFASHAIYQPEDGAGPSVPSRHRNRVHGA